MKRSELAQHIKEMIVDVLSEVTVVDKMTTPDEIPQIAKDEKKDPKTVKQAISTAKQTGKPVSIAEEDEFDMDDEKEPSAKDIKKEKGLAKAKEELAQLIKKMKAKAQDYKAAEGDAKEKIKDELKAMTAEKKKLEKLL